VNEVIGPRSRKIWRIIANSLGVFALDVWIFDFYVWYRYEENRPQHPEPSIGRVLAQNDHGRAFYLTKAEDTRLTELTISALGLFGCAGVVYYFILGERTRKAQPWDKKQF
jgi:hypothetical protein